MAEYKIYKRKSKEYKQYIEGIINTYNTNGKKTLLIVGDNAYPVVDGVWRVLENCATVLVRDYPDYNVLFMGPDYKGNVYVGNFPVLSVNSKYMKSMHYQVALPPFDCRLKKWLKMLKIDIIHCHSPFLCGFLARKLHKKRNVPMIATFHSQYKQDFRRATHSNALTSLLLKIIMKVFNSADEVWTMHRASRETLYSYGYRGKCRLVPNATRMKPLENYDEVRNEFRRTHNVQDKTVFVFVGRLILQKGIMFLVDVLAKLKQRGIDFKMFVVGDGPDKKRMMDRVADNHLNDFVEFVGEIKGGDGIVPYYAGADLFLFPSRYDVSSIVQIEAATYKTPTVFSEGSVTSCAVTGNVNGYLLPYDVDKYADGVEDILKNGDIVKVGEQAFKDLHVEWEDIVEQSVKVYDQYIKQDADEKNKK